MQQRLSLITLGVQNVAAARAFYERLGWRTSPPSNEHVAFFQAGGLIVSLYQKDALAEDSGLPPAAPGAIALAHNLPSKADVDALLTQAQQAGARLLKPAEDKFWGGYSGYFADPDGHPWEIAWNPGFDLRADGTVWLPA